jgi:hypothetical protein
VDGERRMSFLERIPRRIAFVILIIVMVVPILFPFPLPVPVTENTRNYYDIIEALEPGSVVFYGTSIETRDVEVFPQHVATLKHLKEKNVILMTYCFGPGIALGTEWAYDAAGYDELEYGTDYVHLGFMPGEDATLTSFCNDMVGTKQVDHYGNPTATMPLFQKVKTIDDVDLVIASGGGTPGPDTYARIVVIPYNKDSVVQVPGAFAAMIYDFINLGVFDGGIIAQRGAVEYEAITGHAGRATAMFAPIFISSTVLLALMILANLALVFNRMKGGQ